MKIKKLKLNLKIISMIFFSIISILIILILIDYCCFNSFEHGKKTYFGEYQKNNKNDIEIAQKYIYDTDKRSDKFEKVENANSKLKSIVLFGFPSVSGFQLEENKSISYYLGSLTKRPVYNRVKTESSANHLYYQLSNEQFYKIVLNPEYIFYFYIPKQVVQTGNKVEFCPHGIFYRIDRGRLKRYKKIPLNKKSFISTRVDNFLYTKKYFKDLYLKKNKKLFKTLLIESKKEALKHHKDINFVFICFSEPENKTQETIIMEIRKNGFEVFELYRFIDFKNNKYRNQNEVHYNSVLWKDIAGVLVREFNL